MTHSTSRTFLLGNLIEMERAGIMECNCGSTLERFPRYDARGIFLYFACDKCEQEKESRYRPDIFTDSNYWVDEDIEESE